MEQTYYKDSNDNLYLNPSEKIILKYDLTEITEAQFNEILTEKNTPTTAEKLDSLNADFKTEIQKLVVSYGNAGLFVGHGNSQAKRQAAIAEKLEEVETQYNADLVDLFA